MVKKILFLVALGANLFAGQLVLVDGNIKAHTEVFGDSTIDPATKKVDAMLMMEDSIESLNGTVSINSGELVSDNTERDEHMYEAIEVKQFPKIAYKINSVTKNENGYQLNGEFTLHGVSKPLNVNAEIKTNEDGTLSLNSTFSILSTEYGIKPVTLLFLTVRDQIDITVSLKLKG